MKYIKTKDGMIYEVVSVIEDIISLVDNKLVKYNGYVVNSLPLSSCIIKSIDVVK